MSQGILSEENNIVYQKQKQSDQNQCQFILPGSQDNLNKKQPTFILQDNSQKCEDQSQMNNNNNNLNEQHGFILPQQPNQQNKKQQDNNQNSCFILNDGGNHNSNENKNGNENENENKNNDHQHDEKIKSNIAQQLSVDQYKVSGAQCENKQQEQQNKQQIIQQKVNNAILQQDTKHNLNDIGQQSRKQIDNTQQNNKDNVDNIQEQNNKENTHDQEVKQEKKDDCKQQQPKNINEVKKQQEIEIKENNQNNIQQKQIIQDIGQQNKHQEVVSDQQDNKQDNKEYKQQKNEKSSQQQLNNQEQAKNISQQNKQQIKNASNQELSDNGNNIKIQEKQQKIQARQQQNKQIISQQKVQKQPKQPSDEKTKNHKQVQKKNIFEQKINDGIKCKNQGNAYFKVKDFVNAIKKYQEALTILQPKSFYGATQAQCLKLAEISSNLLNNLGTCYFNGEDWTRAEIYYTEAITINPRYVKALLKRAIARNNLKNHDQALTDIKLAYQLDSSNQQIVQAFRQIQKDYKIAKQEERQARKKISEKMFRSQKQSPAKTQKNVHQQRQSPKTQVNRKNNHEQQKQQTQQKGENDNLWGWMKAAAGVSLLGYGLYRIFSK